MIGVIYLAWGPLGIGPVRRFLQSYQAHEAGAEHELVILANGVEQGGPMQELTSAVSKAAHSVITLPRPALDLEAYGMAVHEMAHQQICFLNSYSVILADHWLGHLDRALNTPRVSIAGATASWESQAEWRRGRPIMWPYQLLRARRVRRDYPPFPNPHVRTTGFMMRRAALLELDLHRAEDKHATYLLESGQRSITRQVLAAGGRAVVAGRNGRLYDVEQWPSSATFRCGCQSNLLVADNRTEDWRRAPAGLRRRLSRDAWGNEPRPLATHLASGLRTS